MGKRTSFSSWHTFTAAAGIYTAQSAVSGLTFIGIPTIMRSQQVPLDQIGLVSLAMLVWAVKFIWAPLVERFRIAPAGKRRSRQIILVGDAIVAVLLVVLACLARADFTVILVLLLLLAAVSATVDTACDAFIIEQLRPQTNGAGNVAQVGGSYVGLIFGSGVFVIVFSAWGWMPAALLLSVLVIIASSPMALLRERPVLETPSIRPSLANAVKRKEVLIGLCMAVAFEMSGRLAMGLTGPFLIDSGVPLSLVGTLNGLGGVAAGLVGTMAGGFAVHRLGAKSAMMTVSCCHVITLSSVMIAVAFDVRSVPVLASLFMLESGMMAAGFVVTYSRLMGLVSPTQPGVDFTLFQCASAILAAILGFAGSMIGAHFGYSTSFELAAFLACLTPMLLWGLEKEQRRLNLKKDVRWQRR
jgi:MFS transporter, putative signal transducer